MDICQVYMKSVIGPSSLAETYNKNFTIGLKNKKVVCNAILYIRKIKRLRSTGLKIVLSLTMMG